MFGKSRNARIMFWSVEMLIVTTLIFMCTQISFVFSPIGTFISTLFGPIIVAGFFFYMFNPLIKFLGRFRISRNWAIAIIFIVFFGGIIFVIATVIPNLINQVGQLVNNIPKFTKEVEKMLNDLLEHSFLKDVDINHYLKEMNLSTGDMMNGFMKGVTGSFGTVIGQVTSITVAALTVPIMLFYMLKDGHKLVPNIQRMMPNKYGQETSELLVKMGNTISSYISGQVIECLFVGTFTFIGHLIIGMPYAFLLGFIAGVANIIPYVGPYFGIAPALIIAVTISPWKVLMVIIVVIIVQQIDGNLVYPNVIGRSLNIHPLTIIIILLVAGNIAGILGMILAIPAYAVTKTVVEYFYDIYQVSHFGKEATQITETSESPLTAEVMKDTQPDDKN